jgi:hypothetical protein
MGAAINQLVSYVEKHRVSTVPVPVAAYNLKSNVFCRKAFTEMNCLCNYTEELSVILVIKSHFF